MRRRSFEKVLLDCDCFFYMQETGKNDFIKIDTKVSQKHLPTDIRIILGENYVKLYDRYTDCVLGFLPQCAENTFQGTFTFEKHSSSCRVLLSNNRINLWLVLMPEDLDFSCLHHEEEQATTYLIDLESILVDLIIK